MRRVRRLLRGVRPGHHEPSPNHASTNDGSLDDTSPIDALANDTLLSETMVNDDSLHDASPAVSTPSASPFLTKLPSEVRHLIYDELWQIAYGSTRQHIVWHGSDPDSRHFCRWTCCLPAWERTDRLQDRIHRLRDDGLKPDIEETRRLQSPWLNHWMCGEDIRATTNEARAVVGKISTAFGPCWWEETKSSSSRGMGTFMSMLLVCKTISSECLESIYRCTTFIFTDAISYQVLAGFCRLPPRWDRNPAPPIPAFFEYARQVEICLPANFAANVPCSAPDLLEGPLHDGLDFHWLRLDRFRNLSSLKLWFTSRDAAFLGDIDRPPLPRAPLLVSLGADSLEVALWNLSRIKSVEVSAALHQDVKTVTGEEDGFVERVGPPNIRIWKRGTGDRYHSWIGSITEGGIGDGMLMHTNRYVSAPDLNRLRLE